MITLTPKYYSSQICRFTLLTIASALFVFFIHSCSVVESDVGNLQVQLRDSASQPIVDAEISLHTRVEIPYATEEEFIGVENTGTDGKVLFQNLEPGMYRIDIQADGYLSAWRSVDIAKGKTAKLDVILYK